MIEGSIVGGWTHSILILESQWIVKVYEDNETAKVWFPQKDVRLCD